MKEFTDLKSLEFKPFPGFGPDSLPLSCTVCGKEIPGVANAFETHIALDDKHRWVIFVCGEVCRDDMNGKGPTPAGKIMAYVIKEIWERREQIEKGISVKQR